MPDREAVVAADPLVGGGGRAAGGGLLLPRAPQRRLRRPARFASISSQVGIPLNSLCVNIKPGSSPPRVGAVAAVSAVPAVVAAAAARACILSRASLVP